MSIAGYNSLRNSTQQTTVKYNVYQKPAIKFYTAPNDKFDILKDPKVLTILIPLPKHWKTLQEVARGLEPRIFVE